MRRGSTRSQPVDVHSTRQPASGTPRVQLEPWKPGKFRVKQFSDNLVEFVTESGRVVAMKQRDPSGEYRFERKK